MVARCVFNIFMVSEHRTSAHAGRVPWVILRNSAILTPKSTLYSQQVAWHTKYFVVSSRFEVYNTLLPLDFQFDQSILQVPFHFFYLHFFVLFVWVVPHPFLQQREKIFSSKKTKVILLPKTVTERNLRENEK